VSGDVAAASRAQAPFCLVPNDTPAPAGGA